MSKMVSHLCNFFICPKQKYLIQDVDVCLLIHEGVSPVKEETHKWIVLAKACLNIDRHNALIANFMDEAPNKCELD